MKTHPLSEILQPGLPETRTIYLRPLTWLTRIGLVVLGALLLMLIQAHGHLQPTTVCQTSADGHQTCIRTGDGDTVVYYHMPWQ